MPIRCMHSPLCFTSRKPRCQKCPSSSRPNSLCPRRLCVTSFFRHLGEVESLFGLPSATKIRLAPTKFRVEWPRSDPRRHHRPGGETITFLLEVFHGNSKSGGRLAQPTRRGEKNHGMVPRGCDPLRHLGDLRDHRTGGGRPRRNSTCRLATHLRRRFSFYSRLQRWRR